MKYRLIILLCLFCLPSLYGQSVDILKKSIEQQATLGSASMDVKQSKYLPSLKKPVITRGKLVIIPKKAFLWKMGKPATQTTIFDGQQVVFLNELKKTGKVFRPTDRKIQPVLLMLGMGDGATYDGMMKLFRVKESSVKNGIYTCTLLPKKGDIRRGLKQMTLFIDTKTHLLKKVSWIQRDDSVVTTEYSNIKKNTTVPASTFKFNIADYKWE